MNNIEHESPEPTLKTLRLNLDLSQEELGRRASVSFRTVAECESGRQMPRLDNAIAFARELGVSLKGLARSMRLDVSNVPDDFSLVQLKVLCRELEIHDINDLPDNFDQLIKMRSRRGRVKCDDH